MKLDDVEVEVGFAYGAAELLPEQRSLGNELEHYPAKVSEYGALQDSMWEVEETTWDFIRGGNRFINSGQTILGMNTSEPELWTFINTALHTSWALFAWYEFYRTLCRFKRYADEAKAVGETIVRAIAQQWLNIVMAVVAMILTYYVLSSADKYMSGQWKFPTFNITIPLSRRKTRHDLNKALGKQPKVQTYTPSISSIYGGW